MYTCAYNINNNEFSYQHLAIVTSVRLDTPNFAIMMNEMEAKKNNNKRLSNCCYRSVVAIIYIYTACLRNSNGFLLQFKLIKFEEKCLYSS